MAWPIVRKLSDERAHDDIRGCHADGTPNGQWPATNAVNNEETENHRNQLSDIDHARKDERHLVILTEATKQQGSIVDKPVDSAELLEERNAHADCYPLPALEEVKPRRHLETEARLAGMAPLKDLLLELDLGDDGLEFSLNTPVGGWEAAEFGKTLETFGLASNETQPTRTVRKDVDADSKDRRTYHLQTERKPE